MRVIALVVPSLLATVQYLLYGSKLPARMATHFDANGLPNGWMSRDGFFAFYAGILAFMLLVVVVLAPASIGRLPPSMINLPNRDYWLAPERAAATKAKLGRLMAGFGLGVGLFVVYVMQLVLQSNLGGGTLSSASAVPAVIGFLIFVAGFVVVTVRSFSARNRPSAR
jgi:uncharacterized membrane protein